MRKTDHTSAMEPSRDHESTPEILRPRSGPLMYSRSPYSRVAAAEDDRDHTNSHTSQKLNSAPVVPAVSEMTGLPTFGLGITDSQGRVLESPVEYGFARSSSDPFSDPEDTPQNRPDRSVRYPPYATPMSDGDPEGLRSPPTATNTPRVDGNNMDCPSRRNVIQRRTSWLSISILVLAFYSTAFSGVYLVAAFIKPRFGAGIGVNGGMAPSTATLLSAFFAKTIELSFVTVFVAFLGQVLSRRSLTSKAYGVTISEMSMRGWIMQPGTLITHWENVKHAGLSFLGMISLTAALMALLYTTAAESLVSPKLRMLPIKDTLLYGNVSTRFANAVWLNANCEGPITTEMDPVARDGTCIQMYHVGQAYHNYQQYLEQWGREGDNDTSLKNRIKPIGTWNENTKLVGSYIEIQDMAEASSKHKRMINNVTVAMPHAGVFAATKDPSNNLGQSDDTGQGEFHISASVASPFVNVLCAGMTEEELKPLVYTEWPNTPNRIISEEWTGSNLPDDIPKDAEEWKRNNKTVVDEIFEFGIDNKQAPFFATFPGENQTLLNTSRPYPFGIFILAAPPKSSPGSEYVLCSLNGGLTSRCSTEYHATASGGELNAYCDDDNTWAYRYVEPEAPLMNYDPEWANLAGEWARSVNLADGLTGGKSSNARLLTQLTPPFDNKTNTASLLPDLPSIAEALGTLAGSTLLLATEHSPFSHFWPYDDAVAPGGSVYHNFTAAVRVTDYASGSTENWQNAFFIVLILVFLTNLICLIYLYFGIWGVQLTDFTEPQNTFALALNSPPSSRLNGACGGGPEGPQLTEKWVISMDEYNEHYFITSKAESKAIMRASTLKYQHLSPDAGLGQPPSSPAVVEYRRLSSTKGSLSLLQR